MSRIGGTPPGPLATTLGSETVAVREGWSLRAWAGPGDSRTEWNELTVDAGVDGLHDAEHPPPCRRDFSVGDAHCRLGRCPAAMWKSMGETPTITELDAYKPIVTELPLEGRIIARDGSDPGKAGVVVVDGSK